MADKETQPKEKIETEASPVPVPVPVLVQGAVMYETGKSSWPELVGLTGEEAEKKIKEEKPGAVTYVVPVDSFVTMDYRTDRVHIFIDSSGKVVNPPRIG